MFDVISCVCGILPVDPAETESTSQAAYAHLLKDRMVLSIDPSKDKMVPSFSA